MSTPHRIQILVSFVAEIPDGDLEADNAADEIADGVSKAIAEHVNRIYDESVSVIDWTDLGVAS